MLLRELLVISARIIELWNYFYQIHIHIYIIKNYISLCGRDRTLAGKLTYNPIFKILVCISVSKG